MTRLLSREELLEGGMAGRVNRQASTLLALIENQTAHLMGESRQAAARYVTIQPDAAASSQAFLAAMAQGRRVTLTPTIYDLEKYASQWAILAPENPSVRAAVAHLLGRKYRFTRRVTPGLRSALGLDGAAAQQAYQALYGQPLATIYRARLNVRERLRWFWTRLAARLENLSPFWTAFSLTLTETVGAGILALPITLALIGPMAGMVVLLVLGLVNVLTLAAVTEAITRNGNFRYGLTYFGRLVTDFLGGSGAWLFAIGLLGMQTVALFAYYTGIATTMASVTGLPSMIWPLLLFVITLFVLRQKTLGATVASPLVAGAINLATIVILSLLALPYVRLENLHGLNLPFVSGRPFDPGLIELVFGAVLISYAGHTSVGNMAKTVLRRDPSGRTLLWGNVAAMLTVTALYMLWVFVVNGAIPASILASERGTALIPLAAMVGRSVDLFGVVFVLLGMGVASLHFSLGVFNQVREWLPASVPAASSSKRNLLHNRVVQFWLATMPLLLICLINLWLLYTGRESFSRPLGLVGALAVPLVTGVFPVLLFVGSRRKGDYTPGTYWRWLGNPVVVTLLYTLFFASLVLHGLVIWQNPVERTFALVTSLMVAGVTLMVAVRGIFRPRVVVELRQLPGRGDHALLTVEDNSRRGAKSSDPLTGPGGIEAHYDPTGQPIQTVAGEVPNFSRLVRLTLRLPATRARELKVWAHQAHVTGDSTALPAHVTVGQGEQTAQYDLARSGGQVVTPLKGEPFQIEITLAPQRDTPPRE